ncbi:hypothetical protein [Planococcus shixiaomingii]|uniref:hypothetical protein n=1 Tax=Planococcus shixiaomingii TaxID=3058393 RepID=UPI00260184D2|nr:hypothetical protein [Planococcus sp. N022]WKA56662.1 hypothetical protein QWY21_10035 [Planococcus sp. N022]
MRWLVTLANRSIQLCAILSISAAAFIFALTLWQVSRMRDEILRVNDTFTSLSQVGFLNVYTNNLFFNAYTLAMMVLLCCFIGCIWALFIKKRTMKQNNNNINLIK